MSVDSQNTWFSTFETAEAAQQAAETLKEIDAKIQDWYTTHPGERTGAEDEPPTPVEIELAQKYQLDWTENWGMALCYEFETTTFQRVLILYEEEGNWNPHHDVLNILIAKLGGKEVVQQSVVNGGEIMGIEVQLTCNAADEQTAARVYEESDRYLKSLMNCETQMVEEDWDEEQEAAYFNSAPWFGFEDVLRTVEGNVRRDGERKLSFSVQMAKMWQQFPEFVKQLQGLGFSDIRYTFAQADGVNWMDEEY